MIPHIASGLVDRCISNATYRNQKPWGEETELSSQNSSPSCSHALPWALFPFSAKFLERGLCVLCLPSLTSGSPRISAQPALCRLCSHRARGHFLGQWPLLNPVSLNLPGEGDIG